VSATPRHPEDQVPIFTHGMIWVTDGRGMIIVKDFGCLKERDSMLLRICASLLGIPFKVEHSDSKGNLTFEFTRVRKRRSPL